MKCRFWIGIALLSVNAFVQAGEVSCREGGEAARNAYQRGRDLYDTKTGPLGEQDQKVILALLANAVREGCNQAALLLAYINFQGFVANVGKDEVAARKFDDAVDSYLQEAIRLDEGWFEYAVFLATQDSHHYNPKRAQQMLEQAAKRGDKRAMNELASVYRTGGPGIHPDEKRSGYWTKQYESQHQ